MKANNHIRKDQQGRNTVEKLRYYSCFYSLGDYLSLNINQRITVRTSYCGVEYPSVMIKEHIEFEQQKELDYLANRMYKASFAQ